MRTSLALALALVVACGPKKEDIPSGPGPAEEPAAPAAKPPPPAKHALTVAELGTCHLTASGAVTADQTTPGGRSATNVSYWLTEAERKKMMGVDGFVVNCIGPDIKFQLVPGGGKQDGMPFAPKRYDFVKGKGDANIMAAFGKASLTAPTGTIDITAFDTHHIVGTVDVTGKLTPGNGDVKLTGSFDLACPGFSGCDK
jgi:hypothetical protein